MSATWAVITYGNWSIWSDNGLVSETSISFITYDRKVSCWHPTDTLNVLKAVGSEAVSTFASLGAGLQILYSKYSHSWEPGVTLESVLLLLRNPNSLIYLSPHFQVYTSNLFTPVNAKFQQMRNVH